MARFTITEEEIQTIVKEAMAGKISDATLEEQFTKYHTGRNGATGHGFAAEDVNARVEMLQGKTVEKVGIDNAKHGADRVTDGKMIQSKYCKSAYSTVNAAFGEDGMYCYKTRNGRPMQLEVPRDQYDKVVEIIKQKIKDGKVPTVKDPEYANKMVKKGFLTYAQSVDAARSGNLTSLAYDTLNGSVTGLYAFGISGTITYLAMVRSGASPKEAIKEAAKTGGKSFLVATGTNVAVSQTEKFLNDVAADGVKKTLQNFHLFPKEAAQAAVKESTQVATEQASKKVVSEGVKSGAKKGASNFVKTGARANVIAAAVTTAVVSIPDINKARKGQISKGECAENIAENGASVAAGMAAFSVGSDIGAKAGAALGTFIGGPVGTAIGGGVGFVTGAAIGMAGSYLSSKGIHKCRRLLDKEARRRRKKKNR